MSDTHFTYNKRMYHQFQDLLFVLDVINVFALNDVLFFHCLKGKLLSFIFLETSNFDVSEGT
jgi:hypothetical protein